MKGSIDRKFDGKVYKYAAFFSTKREITAWASKKRRGGALVRVTEAPRGGYRGYIYQK